MASSVSVEKGEVWEFENYSHMIAVESGTFEEGEKVPMLWDKTKDLGEVYKMETWKFGTQLDRTDRVVKEPHVKDLLKGNKIIVFKHKSGCYKPLIESGGLEHVSEVTGKSVGYSILGLFASSASPPTFVAACAAAHTTISLAELADLTSDTSDLRPDQWMNVELVNVDDEDEPAEFICEHCNEHVDMPGWVEKTVDKANNINL